MDTKSISNLTTVPSSKNSKTGQAKAAERTDGFTPSTAGADARSESVKNYGVNVSKQGRDIADARQRAMEIARNTPDVREDKVAELRKRIQEGRYQVNPEAIADGMLKEAVRDEIALSMHEEAKQRTTTT